MPLIVVSDTIVVMLLTRDRFADFVTGSVGDPEGTDDDPCLTAESPQEVDRLVGTRSPCGGSPWLPKMAEGPMYGHSFADPDGTSGRSSTWSRPPRTDPPELDLPALWRPQAGVLGGEGQQIGPLRGDQGGRLATRAGGGLDPGQDRCVAGLGRCRVAVNLRLCSGTTRSSWSPVITSVAG